MISESYKNKIKKLSGILINETKNSNDNFEYMLRDIGGPVFYKRKVGENEWIFISAEDFAIGLNNGGKLINEKK